MSQAVFERLEGVSKVESGYAGGTKADPSYETCTGRTGHAEVAVTFDPEVIHTAICSSCSSRSTTRRRSIARDRSRNAISVGDLHVVARAAGDGRSAIRARTDADVFGDPIVTEVAPLTKSYPAEDYHQGYFRNNPNQPYCRAMVAPKVAKLRSKYAERLKKEVRTG